MLAESTSQASRPLSRTATLAGVGRHPVSAIALLEPLANSMPASTWVIDHTTTAPTPTVERIARGAKRGKVFIHAPVFMAPVNARDGTLSGPSAASPWTRRLTSTIIAPGPVGYGFGCPGCKAEVQPMILPQAPISRRWAAPAERRGVDDRLFIAQPLIRSRPHARSHRGLRHHRQL